MKLMTLPATDLPRALPMREAVEAMKSAFATLSTGRAAAPQRGVIPVADADGITLLMGAYLPGEGLASKTVSIFHRNTALGKKAINGLVLVLDPETGEPLGLLDGAGLTAWRTGAATGAATDLLAREAISVGAVVGAGVQARTQVLAVDCVRHLEVIRVYALEQEQAERLVDDLQSDTRARLTAVASSADAVREADVVCTATSSSTPVFDGRLLRPGAHLNAIGTFTLDRREVDDATVERSRIFVDLVQAALEEAGELVAALEAGLTTSDEWTELGLVAAGLADGRRSPDEITFFKSVGHAVQDVAAAARALRAAASLGLGREVEL
jgi:alanine dehydrogenase